MLILTVNINPNVIVKINPASKGLQFSQILQSSFK